MIGPVAKREGVTDLQTAELIKKPRSIMGKCRQAKKSRFTGICLSKKLATYKAIPRRVQRPDGSVSSLIKIQTRFTETCLGRSFVWDE
jgi:hypothetical protein